LSGGAQRAAKAAGYALSARFGRRGRESKSSYFGHFLGSAIGLPLALVMADPTVPRARCVLTSVSAVASADIRQNFSVQPSNNGEDPFALLLDAVTDIDVGVAQDLPKPERRDDVPAPQARPEADHRQTKRRASEAEKAEKPRPEANATATEAVSDEVSEATDETDSDEGAEESAVDALLTLALGETPQTATGAQIVIETEANTSAQAVVATAIPLEAAAEVQLTAAPSPVAAVVNLTEATGIETTANLPLAAAVKTKAAIEIENAPVAETDAEIETALPKLAADGLGQLLKPLKALPAAATAALDAKPVTIEAAASIPSRALAHLETLNAALSKHFQLAAATETDVPAPEGQKPVFPGNGFLPNLALSVQPTVTVSAPQAAAETARTVPLESLAVEIATRAKNGERRFDIRLDPPELGRIDVRLEIDHKGNTSTKLIVERAETLDMLQRDARGLEKALQSAGLKTDAGGLEFSLRQDTQTQQNQPNAPQAPQRQELLQAEEEASTRIALGDATLAAQLRGGVDIRI
jgi:flagellar hook-length control protein FliK